MPVEPKHSGRCHARRTAAFHWQKLRGPSHTLHMWHFEICEVTFPAICMYVCICANDLCVCARVFVCVRECVSKAETQESLRGVIH